MKIDISRVMIAASVAVVAALISPAEGRAQGQARNLIHVGIVNLHNDRGQVLCEIFASADGFPKEPDKAIAKTQSSIKDSAATCDFAGIAHGTYAVSVFHDENGNGVLDTNFLGIPKEGVGASNDAKGSFGPPKFNDAKFNFPGGRLDLKITIAYLM